MSENSALKVLRRYIEYLAIPLRPGLVGKMKAAPALTSFRRGAWALMVLNIADIVVTILAIRAGATEGNPLAAFLIHTHAIYPLKVLIPGVVIFGAYWRGGDEIDELAVRRLWFVLGIYALTIVVNLLAWARYSG